MSEGMKMLYVMHKRGELSHIAGIETDVLCSMYALVY
jgi:hypothetical protein